MGIRPIGLFLIAASVLVYVFTVYLTPGFYNRRREAVCYLLGAAGGAGVVFALRNSASSKEAS